MRARQMAGLAILGFALAQLRPTGAARVATLRDACVTNGDRASCEELGDALERGIAAPRFPEEAGLAFSEACEAGLATACARAQPWAKSYGDYELFELDVGCMLHDNAFACEEVATSLAHDDDGDVAAAVTSDVGRRIAARGAKALAMHADACAKGNGESCLGAARLHGDGAAVEWNPGEAARSAERACDLGLAVACEARGDASGGSVAIAAYRRACAHDPASPHAWAKLARASAAAGAPRDDVAAAYRRACALADEEACAWEAREARMVIR